MVLISFKCGISSYIGLKFPFSSFYYHYFLLLNIFLITWKKKLIMSFFVLGCSTLDSVCPTKSLLSVSLSLCLSFCLSQSFLEIGLLVFSDIVHDDTWPWYLVTDKAKYLKKKYWWPRTKWSKIVPETSFFAIF